MSASLPFLVHAVIEAIACVSFLKAPELQLGILPNAPRLAPQIRLLTIQYAALLLSSSLTALVFAVTAFSRRALSEKSEDYLTARRYAAAALAVYHLAPAVRGLRRCLQGEIVAPGGIKAWPIVHVMLHTWVFVGLAVVFSGVGQP
ncbi:hypothetical protein HKX48_000495 [Thoreauomyces humboldtii]|nr:hypothetical protein HKX48_000495 [Thoreauomyces humboldtii]